MAAKSDKKTNNALHFLSQLAELSLSETSEDDLPPRIFLLQSSNSLKLRLDASSTLSSAQEQDVYERAGVRTPAETARRDFLGGTTWLKYIVEEIITQNQPPKPGTESVSTGCSILWIAPTRNHAGKGTSSATQAPILSTDRNIFVKVLHADSDPWGWDIDDDNGEKCESEGKGSYGDAESINLVDLNRLSTTIKDHVQRLKRQFQADRTSPIGTPGGGSTFPSKPMPVIIVWESLSPLLLNHGVTSTLRLVQSCCRGCLVILPILNELLTPVQHTRFEDAAWACLWLNQGEMTLIRKGVRETGNVVREMIDFELVPVATSSQKDMAISNMLFDGSNKTNYRLTVVEKPLLSSSKRTESGDDVDKFETEIKSTATADSSTGISKVKRPGKIQLRLEAESDTRISSRTASTIKAAVDSSIGNGNRPRIYLQDDDPEFDDLDEEDPDDDLDI